MFTCLITLFKYVVLQMQIDLFEIDICHKAELITLRV